jgi:hypothetical protein
MGYPIVETVGIEVETDLINRGDIRHSVDNFTTEHDASIESYAYLHNGIQFKNRPKSTDSHIILGCEFKSRIFTFNYKEDLYDTLCNFLSKMEEMGDSYQSTRSGIHIHICMPYNIQILASSLRAAAHLEQVFFYLGGMGYANRGAINDFSFCRPITKYGPALVPTYNERYCQCFNLKDLYETKSVEEFFYRYGSIDFRNPPGKYTPVRYHWITLYPLLTYGTIEYRIFNKTYNPLYLYTIVKFCQQVSNACLTNKFLQLPENSIYTPNSKDNIIDTLNNFIYKYELPFDITEIRVLEEIINNTPEIVVNNKYCMTHLLSARNDVRQSFSPSYHPPFITVTNNDDVITPNVTTIHTLNQNSHSILG